MKIDVLAYLTVFSVAFFSCMPADRYISFSGYAQGGTYTVKANVDGVDESPRQIRDSVEAILRNIDSSLSGYNRNSLLSRFNDGRSIVPDELFLDIYERARLIYEETSGIVDVASAPLFDIWGFGFRTGQMPDEQMLVQAKEASGMGRLHSDIRGLIAEDGTLSPSDLLCNAGELPRLNYNAIAQGYSCDKVAEYLSSLGVKDMMVDIGEIFCAGKNPSGKPWRIGIDRPVDGNNDIGAEIQGIFDMPVRPCGVVTSGNYRKFYIRDGRKYAHTIDPLAGRPVEHNLLSATILAPDALTADAYATYCMVIGLEASMEFIASRDDLQGCLVYDCDGEFRTWCPEGFVLQ